MRAIRLDGHLYATAELAEKLAPWPVVVCDEWEIEQLQGEGYAGMCLRHPSPEVRQAGQAFMALPAAERLARIRAAAKNKQITSFP